MFLFTASAHFTAMKHDLAAMIPAPFTGSLPIVYATGVLEVAGAFGILGSRTRRAAGIGLILLMLAMFPANVSAARRGVSLRGEPPSALVWRAPLQLLFIAAVWWVAIHRAPEERRRLAAV
ncbi:MAG: DoxX family protein [Thermoanaerobaculia bacterium]